VNPIGQPCRRPGSGKNAIKLSSKLEQQKIYIHHEGHEEETRAFEYGPKTRVLLVMKALSLSSLHVLHALHG